MKKLMIAAAAIAMAVSAQAVTFKWQSSSVGWGIDTATISGYGNGNYSVGSSAAMKNVGTLTYVLAIYESGTYGTAAENLIGSITGDVSYNATGKYAFAAKDVSGTAVLTTYDYALTITGYQSDIRGLGAKVTALDAEGTYDYTAASLTKTMTGSITTKAAGATQLTDLPGDFAVSGIVFTAKEDPEPTPEPTSAMLMLLGMAGLALRRKQK